MEVKINNKREIFTWRGLDISIDDKNDMPSLEQIPNGIVNTQNVMIEERVRTTSGTLRANGGIELEQNCNIGTSSGLFGYGGGVGIAKNCNIGTSSGKFGYGSLNVYNEITNENNGLRVRALCGLFPIIQIKDDYHINES